MADQLKHPATIIAGVNTVVLAAGIYYVYQQISGLKTTVADLERQLANLKITLATIKEQDVSKGKLVRETNEKVNTISAKATEEIEALSSYISAMNTDLYGLADQLNSNGIQVELISVASAVSTYRGEMHFPSTAMSPYPPQFSGHTGAGVGATYTTPPGQGQGHNPNIAATVGPSPGVRQHAHLGLPGAAKMPFAMPIGGRMPHQQHPQHMQMRMGGGYQQGSSHMMGPAKPKDPDPIGDLVELAQSQTD